MHLLATAWYTAAHSIQWKWAWKHLLVKW